MTLIRGWSKRISTSNLRNNPNTMNGEATCAARQILLHSISMIKDNHKNTETDMYSIDALLKTSIIKFILESNCQEDTLVNIIWNYGAGNAVVTR